MMSRPAAAMLSPGSQLLPIFQMFTVTGNKITDGGVCLDHESETELRRGRADAQAQDYKTVKILRFIVDSCLYETG